MSGEYSAPVSNFTVTPLTFEGYRLPNEPGGYFHGERLYHDRIDKWDPQARSCRAVVPLNTKALFEGFAYVGSHSGDVRSGPMDLRKDREPSVPQAEVAYVYRPQSLGNFETAGTTLFIERLRRQGFQIESAPGIHGWGFATFDPGGAVFVIDFSKGPCSGSIRGTQDIGGSEEYVLRLRPGCK